MRYSRLLALAALSLAVPAVAVAQAAPKMDTGMVAPAFSAPGANKAGVLKSVSLADYKGKTVVLAFFYQARTKG